MITAKYMGRLGNQMFQFASAASLALENDDIFDAGNWEFINVFESDPSIIFSGIEQNFPN